MRALQHLKEEIYAMACCYNSSADVKVTLGSYIYIHYLTNSVTYILDSAKQEDQPLFNERKHLTCCKYITLIKGYLK